MKKKLVSTALAAIMSVTALAGSIMSANATFRVNYLNTPDPQPSNYYYNIEVFSNSMRKVQISKKTVIKEGRKYVTVDNFAKVGIENGKNTIRTFDGEEIKLPGKENTLYQANNYGNYHYVRYNGDIDNDGRITANDRAYIYYYINGRKALNYQQFFFADINNDDLVDVEDFVAITNHINGVKSIY